MLRRPRNISAISIFCAVLLSAAIGSGCSLSAPTPSISNVWPATIVPGRTHTLLITGQGFRDGATATLAGTIPLPGVVWINDQYITTSVPAGIGGAGSRYSIVVTNPDQQQAVSPQPISVGALPATATPAPTKEALPTATRERPSLTPTPIAATPTLTPTPAATAPAGPPVIILNPPPQPPSPTASPSPTPVLTPTPSVTPSQAPLVSPPQRGEPGALLAPFAPDRPLKPGPPGRRSQR